MRKWDPSLSTGAQDASSAPGYSTRLPPSLRPVELRRVFSRISFISRAQASGWNVAGLFDCLGRIPTKMPWLPEMKRYYAAGFTTFDMADHYGDAELFCTRNSRTLSGRSRIQPRSAVRNGVPRLPKCHRQSCGTPLQSGVIVWVSFLSRCCNFIEFGTTMPAGMMDALLPEQAAKRRINPESCFDQLDTRHLLTIRGSWHSNRGEPSAIQYHRQTTRGEDGRGMFEAQLMGLYRADQHRMSRLIDLCSQTLDLWHALWRISRQQIPWATGSFALQPHAFPKEIQANDWCAFASYLDPLQYPYNLLFQTFGGLVPLPGTRRLEQDRRAERQRCGYLQRCDALHIGQAIRWRRHHRSAAVIV